MTAGPVPGRWQRFLRFSVRGLIVLVLVMGAGLGWLARSARDQREAVAAIKSARGSVAYNWAFYNGRIIRNPKPWAPRWLVAAVESLFRGETPVQTPEMEVRYSAPNESQFWRT